jgi:hypothetical protein
MKPFISSTKKSVTTDTCQRRNITEMWNETVRNKTQEHVYQTKLYVFS